MIQIIPCLSKPRQRCYEFDILTSLRVGFFSGENDLNAGDKMKCVAIRVSGQTEKGRQFGIIGTGLTLSDRKRLLINVNVFKPYSAYDAPFGKIRIKVEVYFTVLGVSTYIIFTRFI
uniref:Uncharacterized protein n=1 Tax=Treubia lacunosa TaxID=93845 RepID=G4Y9Q0_9MARC|nr:hypothetical protein TrlaMp01 [Treubia lacunosa]AEH99696.1 hypothetical protein TrlaMp01 [Treubia lacunosa]